MYVDTLHIRQAPQATETMSIEREARMQCAYVMCDDRMRRCVTRTFDDERSAARSRGGSGGGRSERAFILFFFILVYIFVA